jgi:hypothetical protein
MTPQASFMIVAAVDPAKEAELRRLLASMNDAPGRVKADNPLIPFAQFDTLHVARLLLVDDKTLADIEVYGIPRRRYPLSLAFLGDVDGDAEAFLEEAARRAGNGLRALFGCCEGFRADGDLVEWMRMHRVVAAASYVNWRGRTVGAIREAAALREALERHVRTQGPALESRPPTEVHAALRKLVQADVAAGRLTLSPERPTPLRWWLGNLLHLVGLPLLLLLTLPVVLVALVVGLLLLRRREQTDPEFCPRVDALASAELALLEDHDVSNQFSAMGSLKPGVLRLWTTVLVLLALDWGTRHIYTRGRLARVRTIHFARWVFLDDRERIIFLSNYDGSLESYMDDFINKVGFGLNLAFGNGVGYPRTRWLLLDGCQDERKFKEFLRRHQLPTQVWYKAYPGLTAVDLERNGRIRQGLESATMTDRDAREWVALL